MLRQGDALVIRGLTLALEGPGDLDVANSEDRPRDDHQREEEARHDRHALIAPGELAETVPPRWRAGLHRLVAQVALHVRRKTASRLVTAVAILIQYLHHDPVQ